MLEASGTPREFVCFGKRPAHAALVGTPRIVWMLLKEAKGFYVTGGMTVRDFYNGTVRLRALLPHIGGTWPKPLVCARIRRALAHLVALGLAERVEGSTPQRWRKPR